MFMLSTNSGFGYDSKGLFGNVINVIFQYLFNLKMHQNNIFFNFKKFIFDISISKRFKNTKK
jgi:hypothetical protein